VARIGDVTTEQTEPVAAEQAEPVAAAEEPRATAADAVLALTLLGVRSGMRAGAVVFSVFRPAYEAVWYADMWPTETARKLAAAGLRHRRDTRTELVRRYHAVLPVVVVDALDQLDLAGIVRAADVPRIVQDATSSVVSENLRGVRLQAYAADRAVARWLDRALNRRDPGAR
jgi:hypothetical protein